MGFLPREIYELLFRIEVRIYCEISFKDFKDKSIHYIVNYFDPDIVGIVAEDSDDIDDEGLDGEFPHVFFHYTTDDLED